MEGGRMLAKYNIKDQSTLHMAEQTSRSRNKRPRRWSRRCSLCEELVQRPLVVNRCLATCCICMGTLGTEHDNPEKPESISHGRPEGWTTCSSCTFTRVDLGGGRFYWQHSCPNDRPPRTHSRSGREGLRVGANNGCAIEGTVGNGMAQSDRWLTRRLSVGDRPRQCPMQRESEDVHRWFRRRLSVCDRLTP